MKHCSYALLTLALFALGCVGDDAIHFPEGEVEGMRPIYADAADLRDIRVEAPRALERPGKIYRKDGFLFINELAKGVHVINNMDPTSPVPLAFISIPGNVDIAAKGNVFYFDNINDLVAVRVTNGNQIEVLKRIENVLDGGSEFPEARGMFFECVDKSKGVVVGWEKATISNPKCFR